jgi:chorismate mutase
MNVSELAKAAKKAAKKLNKGFEGEVFLCTDEATYEVSHVEFTGEEFHIHGNLTAEDRKDRAEEALRRAMEEAEEAGLDQDMVINLAGEVMED